MANAIGVIAACAIACVAARPVRADPAAFGDYEVARVVDGDTIRVRGLDTSLRLLAIDTEETFKHDAERKAFAAGWASYVVAVRGHSPRPVKFATPMGEAAKTWAEQWFAGVGKVRLERDAPDEIHDRYGRYLAYVLALKAGTWRNYNVECVRAGMSPYFTKYGGSRRYAKEFTAAEAEAKAAHRGIWAAGAQAYPDYAEREAWWAARGQAIDAFRGDAAAHDDHVDLSREDAIARLEALVGHDVTVLGSVLEVKHGGGKQPTLVLLAHRAKQDVPLVIFDRDVLAASGLAAAAGELVVVTGKPSLYKQRVQLVIDRADQVRVVKP